MISISKIHKLKHCLEPRPPGLLPAFWFSCLLCHFSFEWLKREPAGWESGNKELSGELSLPSTPKTSQWGWPPRLNIQRLLQAAIPKLHETQTSNKS